MGLFDLLDVAGAEDIKYDVLKGKFKGIIHEVTVGDSSNGNFGMMVTFEIPDRDATPKLWFALPRDLNSANWDKDTILTYPDGTPKKEKYNTEFKENTESVKKLKKFLVDIGIPAKDINSVDPETGLIGIEVVLTMGPQKDNPNFSEVKFVEAPRISGATLPQTRMSPSASSYAAAPRAATASAATSVENPFLTK